MKFFVSLILSILIGIPVWAVSTLSSYKSVHGLHNNLQNMKLSYICHHERYKWLIRIDLNNAKATSSEIYSDIQKLIYQGYTEVGGDAVYEFMSDDTSPSNDQAYILYFNLEKEVATVTRIHSRAGSGIETYEFTCTLEQSLLLPLIY